jgi:putative membrane protein
MNPEAFSNPRRQHPLGLLGYFVKNLYALVKGFWPVAAGLALSSDVLNYGSWIGLAVISLIVVSAIIEYRVFKFHVTKEALIVHTGWIEKDRMVIPFDRIQAVHLHQSAWHQALGLCGLKVDTAGSGGSELDFAALNKEEALSLRALLTGGKSKEAIEGDDSIDEAVVSERGPAVVELSLLKLLKVGLTQNHLRNGLIALGAIVTVLEPLQRWWGSWIESLPDWTVLLFAFAWVLFIVPAFILFVFLAVLVSMVSAFIKYFRLRVDILGPELALESGLFRRNEFRIPLTKVQMLEWKSTWLRRKLNLETLQIHQARAQEGGGAKALGISIPGIELAQSNKIVEVVFPKWNPEVIERFRPEYYLRYRLFVFALIPLLPAGLFLGWGWLWCVLTAFWVPFRWMTTQKKFEGYRVTTDGVGIMIESGWWVKRRVLLQWHQLQRISFHQNKIHEPRGLAHVTLHSAAGSRSIQFLKESDAKRLVDFAAYSIESHRGSWM